MSVTLTCCLFCDYEPVCLHNISVIPTNLTANYCSSLFSELNEMQHPSKSTMNFSKRKKASVEKVILYVSFIQSPLLIEIRALPQSSQLSKLPKIINHVRRLKFRGGATLRPLIAVKPFLESEHFYAQNRSRPSVPFNIKLHQC